MSETIVIESLESIAFGLPADDVTVIEIESTGAAGAAGTNGTNGGSTSAWNYKAKTNSTSGYPGTGYLLWNNATQLSATSIIVSHINTNDEDLELLLGFFVSGQKLFIQDRDDSSQNQVWQISGTPTVTGANTSTAYFTFPVTLVSSAGSAFTNNHQLLFGAISVASNSVTSATTSDGTANLSVLYLSSETGIATTGADAAIGTTGENSNIFTTGSAADITTESATASVRTTNFAAYETTGASLKTSAGTAIATFGVSGQNFTFTSGTALTFDNTSFAYGTGAAAAHRTALGLGTLATQSGTFSGTSSGTNTGDQTTIVGISGTLAEFNTALTGADFATLAGSETLTNKTLTNPTLTTPVLGTPISGTLTSCTGLPVSTGVSGLGTGVATFLATPTSANLAAAVTDETGSGSLVFATSPTLTTPTIRGGGTGFSNALIIQDSGSVTSTKITDNGNVGVGGYIPSGHVVTSGFRGIWLDSSNSGLLGETSSNFRGANIVANVVRVSAGAWAQQDSSRNSFILSLGYESSNNGLNLYRAAAGSGNSFSALLGVNTNGQTHIGGNAPNNAAMLQADSTTRGFLPPRMTTAQRDAITSVPAGLMIYNTSTNKLNVFTTAWEQVTSA